MCPTTMASLLRHNTNYGGYSQGSTGIHSRPLVHLPALLLLAVSSRVTASIASEPSVCSTGETSDSTKHTHTHTARYRWAHKQTDTGVRRHVALTEPINKVAFDHVSCLVYSDNTTFFLKYITADATSWTSFSEMTSMSCGQTPYFKILPSMPNHWPLVFEILCSTECTVTFRCHIQHKLGVTVHRCLQGKAPQYLIVCCTPTSEVASCQQLHSASRHQLVVPRYHCSEFGHQAFSDAGPMVWNSLPDHLRDPTLGSDCFKSRLKTYLFSLY